MSTELRGKVKTLQVSTPQGPSGELRRESQYVFNYQTADRATELALGMPVQAASYVSSQPHPIFGMNLPEGNLRLRIRERFAKEWASLDDMAMLSIVGHDQIGRLSLTDPVSPFGKPAPWIGLGELLHAKASTELFDYLLDTYLASGISGVQPKVLVPDADAHAGMPGNMHTTARLSDLIVKASSATHPHLTENEFLCMDAAKRAGLDVPGFHLSDDGSLFIVRRFDRTDTGERLGFEDMSVLAGQKYDNEGNFKYRGSYEGIALIIESYCGPNAAESKQRFFEYFAASCLMRNGDAHMKNFGLLYTSPDDAASVRLSPLYDVVTTSAYDVTNARTGGVTQDRSMALNLNKSKDYPDRNALVAFGHRCNVLKPERVLERIGAGMDESLSANRDRVPAQLWQRMKDEWDLSRLSLEAVRRVRLGGLSDRKSYVAALAPAAPAWTPEQDRKAAGLDAIKGMATGALLTFAELGSAAIERAGSAAKVNWRAVEDQAIAKSIQEDRQPAQDVLRAIAGASPAAVGETALAGLQLRVDRAAKAAAPRSDAGPRLFT